MLKYCNNPNGFIKPDEWRTIEKNLQQENYLDHDQSVVVKIGKDMRVLIESHYSTKDVVDILSTLTFRYNHTNYDDQLFRAEFIKLENTVYRVKGSTSVVHKTCPFHNLDIDDNDRKFLHNRYEVFNMTTKTSIVFTALDLHMLECHEFLNNQIPIDVLLDVLKT